MTRSYHESQNNAYLTQDYATLEGYDRVQFLLDTMGPVMGHAGSLLDLGCAKGEIISFCRKRWPHVDYAGVDMSGSLLELARAYPPLAGVPFHQAEAGSFHAGRRFDVVLASGLLGCFDDPWELLRVMLEHLEPNGTGLVFSVFHPGTLDTFLQFRTEPGGDLQVGLNTFGMQNIEAALNGRVRKLAWHKFALKTDLEYQPDAGPTRSYTVRTAKGEQLILNSLGMLQNFWLLEFQSVGA